MNKTVLEILYKDKSKNNLIKKSFLFGMFYYKHNLKNYSSEFRLFGIPVWKTKFKSGHKRFYFLGLVYFEKSSRKILYNTLLEELGDKYDNIFVNFNCSGETYLFLSYLNPPENSVFVATKKYHVDLCHMMHPDIDCVYLPDVINLRSFDSVYKENYKGKTFYNILPFNHFVKLEKRLRKGEDAHYCVEICKTIGVEYTKTAKCPVISEDAKKSALKKAERIGLNLDNFIFLCPESQSNENPPKDFWIDLVDDMYEKGFDVFINTLFLKEAFGMGKTGFLTFEEAYYIASLSKGIIGLRSGFIEPLTSINNIPITCLYTDFRDRGLLAPIKAEQVLTGFTLTKLPNVSKEEINEYMITDKQNENVIENILREVKE